MIPEQIVSRDLSPTSIELSYGLGDDCIPPSSDWIEKSYSISVIYLSNLMKIFNVPLNSSSSLSYLLIKFAVSLLHVS